MNFYEEKLMPLIDTTCAAIEATPHMQDILKGTMPIERFRFQITHNYLYLLEYVRCWSAGLSKSRSFAEMEDWYAIVSDTMEGTVLKNRDFWANKVGLTLEEMDRAFMAEGKMNYTSFQLARCTEGDLANAMMSLFPCNILYYHMAKHLLPQCTLPEDNMYRQWIAFYLSDKYVAKCNREIGMVNRLMQARPDEAEQKRLLNIFATACNYEVLQWQDMYYNMKTWPLPQLFAQQG